MNATNRWLDAVKKRLDLSSDYQLGKVLSISSSRIGNYRSNPARVMDDDLAVKVAEVLKVPAARIIGELHAEKAKSPDVRAAFLRIAQMAACMVILASPLHHSEAFAQGFIAGHEGSNAKYYVKSTRPLFEARDVHRSLFV